MRSRPGRLVVWHLSDPALAGPDGQRLPDRSDNAKDAHLPLWRVRRGLDEMRGRERYESPVLEPQ